MFYTHYKGGLYEFVGVAHVEKTLEVVVVYRGADGTLWTRPVEEFFGTVTVPRPDGPPHTRQRFTPVGKGDGGKEVGDATP